MVHALVLIALLMLLQKRRSPWLCAGLFTAVIGTWAGITVLVGDASVSGGLLNTFIAGIFASVYYWGLTHLKAGTAAWGTLAAAGAVVMMFFFG
jgi:hypothetical protein